MMSRILRPWMPPASLTSSARMRRPLATAVPQGATGPDRGWWLPTTISVSLTPWDAGAGAAHSTAASAAATARFRIRMVSPLGLRSFRWTWPRRGRAMDRAGRLPALRSLAVHGLDHVLVFLVHHLALELHGGRQFLVLGRQLLLDEAELLDRFHPRQVAVHFFHLVPDQRDDLRGAAQAGEVGERDVVLLRVAGDVFVVDHDERGEELAPVADD